MNTTFVRERNKVLTLLGLGAVLLVIFLFRAGTARIQSLQDVFIVLAAFLYPLGVTYGWREMLRVFRVIRMGDHISRIEHIGYVTLAITMMNMSIAFAVTICFGWIFGVYKAIKTLIQLKIKSVEQ